MTLRIAAIARTLAAMRHSVGARIDARNTMTVRFQHPTRSLSQTLLEVRQSIRGEQITLGHLLELIGEQGLLLFVMLLMVPFLLPVSIPGVMPERTACDSGTRRRIRSGRPQP